MRALPRRAATLIAAAFVLVAGLSLPAHADKRLALVIGVDRYSNLAPRFQLQKAGNDADTLGRTLSDLGFEATVAHNPGLDDMIDKVNALALRAEPGDTVLFFFSGHGISPDGTNLLLPSDMPNLTDRGPAGKALARKRSYAELEIIDTLRRALIDRKDGEQRGVIIFISDACRNNPFADGGSGTKSLGGRSIGVEPTSTAGVFSIYAAGSGQEALDRLSDHDPSPNSVFMRVFVDALKRPGAELGEVVRDARNQVAALARTYIDDDTKRPHQQNPAYYDETRGGSIVLAGTAKSDSPKMSSGREDREASADPVGPTIMPAVPDRWANCRPNGRQTADNIGGPASPVILKLALTPAQQNAIAVRTIAVSPDGKFIVTAGDDAAIRVWQAANLRLTDQMAGHRGPIFGAAFSSDGNYLATASFDGTVQLWDGRSFAHVQTFVASDERGPVRQASVAFVPPVNPQYVYSTGADGNVWVWDLRRRVLARKITSRTGADATTAALSVLPNGRYAFATANFDGTVRFFLEDGTVESANAFIGKALRLAYAPDGRLAVAGADALGKAAGIAGVKLWDSSRSYLKSIPAHRGHAASVGWSRDGTYLATGGGFLDTSVSLWNPQTGEELRSFRGHTADVEAVVFHPNQKWLLSGSEDGTIKIWDIAEGRELLSVVGLPNREYVAYAPNNCYTGSANVPSYVKFVYKEGKVEHDVSARFSDVFVPTTDVLLFR